MVTFTTEPGWHGWFTRAEAEDAIPNGTRIRKCWSEEGDAHPVGTTGTVIGSLDARDIPSPLPFEVDYLYFIEWDTTPKVACGTVDRKVEVFDA